MVAGKAVRVTTAGLGLGLIAAYIAARGISSLFFHVGPADTLSLAATCLLLACAAVLAIASPTRHAVQVDPAVALRDE